MQTVVPELTMNRATVARIAIGQLTLGRISVGELIATDLGVGVHSGRAELRDVHITVTLTFRLVWSLHVPMPWWVPDITIAESTADLGSAVVPFPFGDAEIPGLQDINLLIPELRAGGIVTDADSVLGLELTQVQAEGVRAFDVNLPTAGFQLAGLALTAANVNDVSVPAATVRGATIRSVQGAPVRVPTLRLRGLNLPAAAANDVGSGPLDLTINRAEPFEIPPDPLSLGGVLKVQLRVDASARTRVAQMRLSGVTASAGARTIELRNVTVPYGAVEVTLSDLGLDVLEIPLVGVA
jgi:hypothetical protein